MRQKANPRSNERSFPVSAISSFLELRRRGLAGLATFAGTIIVLVISLMTVLAPWISPRDPSAINVGPILSPPSIGFPLGTDHLGRDMLSRVISGGSIMLQVALLSVVICLLLGVPIGLLSAYVGGKLEDATSLVMDCIYAFPGLILAIAIASVLGPGVFNMTLAIVVVYIPSYYRVVRSQVLSIKELTYVDAARAIGADGPTIVFRYILPNVLPSIVAVSSVNFADAILTAAGLTFIGLGLPVTTPDWGWDLTNGRQLLPSGAWWVMTFPGIMIVLLALGFTLIGEGLNELLNPKLEVQVS
jgi:peptide/nickel transport system permease protein